MLKYFQNILFNHKLQNLFKSPDYPANVYLFKVKDEITNYLKLRNHNPSWKKFFYVSVKRINIWIYSQPAIACSKSTVETLEQVVKYVPS